jgi:hypothetical protein
MSRTARHVIFGTGAIGLATLDLAGSGRYRPSSFALRR